MGDSVLTGTEIAEALLDLARALARAQSAQTIEIPTRLDDGAQGHSTLLLGPASQMVSDTEESPYDEIVDDELVQRLRAQVDDLDGRGRIVMAVPVPVDGEQAVALDLDGLYPDPARFPGADRG
ncbi:hypothetical protein NVV95_06950 [Herbiconiux sp. CPCC 205716]|uniref:Uncharacterized protein n=1 Tax=Herbiconiux gentiana TaxID=2970912 RepID=A0ABT2GDW5_9MICO|nr:hypothetical protein [Herbiconiux gentiana]MCS5714291.1 hypothetical protein [Herbiconiux gentiana]